jgi:dipeptidyl aminopeptidase/acylaminoacyl peptidase
MANLSGRVEAHVYDPGDDPAALHQVTDRPQGTLAAFMSPNGDAVLWFDDSGGDEVGRWVRQPVDGGDAVVLAANLDPGFMAGVAPLADGGAVIAYLGDVGMTVVFASADGHGRVVGTSADAGELVGTDVAETQAIIAVAREGDWQHLGVRILRLVDGVVTHERVEQGRGLTPVAFDPSGSSRLLLIDDVTGSQCPAVWDLDSDEVTPVEVQLEGDLGASWYPDGSAILVNRLLNARHTLHRHDLETGETTLLLTPEGTIGDASVRPNGDVHALISNAGTPPMVYRVDHGSVRPLVLLPEPSPPPSVTVQDLFVDGPGGRVHALLRMPVGRSAPHPLIVAVHGGPTFQDFDLWNSTAAAYVDMGYAVLSVNYRGSTGYGAAWRDALHGRLGFIELEDITAVLDHLVAKNVVDASRVSIAGGSWGGFLTLMAVGTQPHRWRSGVALVPVADQEKCDEVSPRFMQAYLESLFGGSIKEIPEVFSASSPITYVDKVVAPLFVSAGVNDPRCPVEQVDSYVEALREAGGRVHYHRIDTGHSVPDMDVLAEELELLLEFLLETNPPTG